MQYDAQSDRTRLIPGITIVAIATCIVVFVGLGATQSDSWRETARWGYISPSRILDGAWWGLLTSVFVHREIWHIAFNLYWLWFLGGAMERSIGSFRYALFFVAAAFVSSSLQMAFGGPGIGMSGVGYAIFGFCWISRNKYAELRQIVRPQVINLFLVWMVACIPLTMLHVLEVGNMAHISGLIFGVLVAWAFALKLKPILAGAGLCAIAVASVAVLFWAPWSEDWVSHRATRAQRAGRDEEAIKLYKRSIELGADKAWAWKNLALIYLARGDKIGFGEAVRNVRGSDPRFAHNLEEEFNASTEANESNSSELKQEETGATVNGKSQR